MLAIYRSAWAIMTTVGCVGGMTVWAAECLAFIEYYEWLSQSSDQLEEHYQRSDRSYVWQRYRPWLSSFQPAVAWIGLLGCLLNILALCSARFWQTKATVAEVTAAYVWISLRTIANVNVLIIASLWFWVHCTCSVALEPLAKTCCRWNGTNRACSQFGRNVRLGA